MKMFNTLLCLFTTIVIQGLKAYAGEYPYETLEPSFQNSGEIKTISPNSPIKAQDDIGICYGFSATSLLENYRCKELNLDCSDPKNFISTLDVTSYYKNQMLIEGAIPSGFWKISRDQNENWLYSSKISKKYEKSTLFNYFSFDQYPCGSHVSQIK